MRKTLAVMTILVLSIVAIGCPQQVEKVAVAINLGSPSLSAKAMTNDGLMNRLEKMKSAATRVSVTVYKQAAWNINGSYANSIQSEYIDLDANKQLVKPVIMPVGAYHVRVVALDIFGNQLFIADKDATITVGMKPLSMTLMTLDQYTYMVPVDGMPGDFTGGWFPTEIFTADGDKFYGNCFTDSNGQAIFYAYLPVWIEWAGIVATDNFGDSYSFDVMFNPLRQTMDPIAYAAGSIAASVDGLLSFGFETQVICNGKLYNRIEDAIWEAYYNSEIADILLFEGVYEVSDLYIPYGLSVNIRGRGTGTILRNVDQYAGATHVIVASCFGVPEQAKGGGSYSEWNISISDLVIENRSEVNRYYSDSALLFEGVDNVSLDNVVVQSANRGLVASYCGSVSVDHSVFVGIGNIPNSGLEFACYDQETISITNSIIKDFTLGIGYGPDYAVDISYNCFWQYQMATSQGKPANCLFVDPELDSNFMLLNGSLCNGAGIGGTNIGLDYQPE